MILKINYVFGVNYYFFFYLRIFYMMDDFFFYVKYGVFRK